MRLGAPKPDYAYLILRQPTSFVLAFGRRNVTFAGATKKPCKACEEKATQNKLMLRFFNIDDLRTGNSPYDGVITKFLQEIIDGEVLTIDGDGEQTRDFIHVNDVVSAIVLVLEHGGLSGEVFVFVQVCLRVLISLLPR